MQRPHRGNRAFLSASGPLQGPMPSDFQLPDGRSGVILFDGVCNFCNRWVSFVLDNDDDGYFAFASLQSEYGKNALRACGRNPEDLSTFVVIDGHGFHTQSSAAMRVASALNRPSLNFLSASLDPVPLLIRDSVYRLVANNRYSLLGKDTAGGPESCKLRADISLVQERFLS